MNQRWKLSNDGSCEACCKPVTMDVSKTGAWVEYEDMAKLEDTLRGIIRELCPPPSTTLPMSTAAYTQYYERVSKIWEKHKVMLPEHSDELEEGKYYTFRDLDGDDHRGTLKVIGGTQQVQMHPYRDLCFEDDDGELWMTTDSTAQAVETVR
jgi:hypothetical protein